MANSHFMEFICAGLAGCGAGIFTTPLEVVKIRMQLQGELLRRGLYTVHYRNCIHAFYTIAKSDGMFALQKGLVPALWFQFVHNGTRLGTYQVIINTGFMVDDKGNLKWGRFLLAGAVSGGIGAAIASPFYLVKTHLQARANEAIAVGTQHPHDSMTKGFKMILKREGIKGLWRGTVAAVTKSTIGSATQLASFSTSKHYIVNLKLFDSQSMLNAFCASIVAGVIITACMTPFDVVATRMYNQPVNQHGQGTLYKTVPDCFIKVLREEGFLGFYKGWGPSFFRLVPHTILSLVFWDQLRLLYQRWTTDTNIPS